MINWSDYEPSHKDASQAQQTTPARIRSVLLNAIGAGALLPGTRIKETEIGAALHVSRTPLREALTALRTEQILEHDGEGVRVRQLTWRDVTDLYDLRATLEGMGARLSAQKSSSTERAIINELCQEEGKLIAQGAHAHVLALHNRRFHNAILQSAGNHFLTEELSRLSRVTILLGNTVYSVPDRLDAIRQEHEAINEAIQKGDGAIAENKMRQHLQNGLKARLTIMSFVKGEELD